MTWENSPDRDDSEEEQPAPPPKILDMLGVSFEPARLDPPPVASIPLVRNARAPTTEAQGDESGEREYPESDESGAYTAGDPSVWITKRNALIAAFGATVVFIILLAIAAAQFGRKAIHRRAADPAYAGTEMVVQVPAESAIAVPVAGTPMQPRFSIPSPPPLSDILPEAPGTAAVETKQQLQIAKAVLCRNVNGFARYEPLTEMRLRARHLPLVQLYIEFEGPQAEVRDDGRHVYRLAQEIRMVRSDSGRGHPLIETTVSLTEVSMGPKRDFFASQYLRPVRPAEPGNYLLEVRLTDQVDNSTVSAKIPVIIVAE